MGFLSPPKRPAVCVRWVAAAAFLFLLYQVIHPLVQQRRAVNYVNTKEKQARLVPNAPGITEKQARLIPNALGIKEKQARFDLNNIYFTEKSGIGEQATLLESRHGLYQRLSTPLPNRARIVPNAPGVKEEQSRPVQHALGTKENQDRFVPYAPGFQTFTHTVTLLCDGRFWGYANLFASLKSVILDPSWAKGRAGGEDIDDVLEQDEKAEFFRFSKGYFSLPCASKILQYKFAMPTYLDQWMTALMPISRQRDKGNFMHVNGTTLAVTRIDYANLYVRTADFYNVFLTCRILQLDPSSVNILLVDGHPKGAVDDVWNTLFADVTRAGHIRHPTEYENLIWSLPGSHSPLNNLLEKSCPLLQDFVDFMLSQHGLPPPKKLTCFDLQILVVLRRDYVAHPRNPKGIIQRKIQNEDELLTSLQNVLDRGSKVKGSVEGVQLDSLSFKEQLKLAAQTDILVGMHGAGLSHTLYLPKHAALVEIFPRGHTMKSHFQGFAKFKSIQYKTYVAKNQETVDHYTNLNTNDIARLVERVIGRMC